VPAAIRHGALPRWTRPAFADSSPDTHIPYALSSDGQIAAVMFAPRLRAGHPSDPANKVLWIVHFPRHGHPLRMAARSAADPGVTVHSSWSADSSPGQIYPSYVDLPRAGCWSLTLTSGNHTSHIDVRVLPRA
jgi:hypothetical protein